MPFNLLMMNEHDPFTTKGITENLTDLVGNTPMIRLHKITEHLPGDYFTKYEAANPGLAAKDRIAQYILKKAEADGRLKPGSTVVETTSGNTGFSLAMTCAVKGYRCILAVSDKSSTDKINLLRTMGAEVHVCPAKVKPDDPRSYYEVAKRIHKETPNSIYINQYFNELNIEAHYHSTGKEIWEQTDGRITHLVSPSGTGGTISGAARYLKEKNPNIKILGVDAYGSAIQKYHETREFDENEIYSYKIEGLGKNLIPKATDFDSIDHFEKVTDEESAYMSRYIAKNEGMFVGYTSGAAMMGLYQYAQKGFFDEDSKVVVVFSDHGSRYMSKIYSEEWMQQQGFTNEDKFTIRPLEKAELNHEN